MKLWFVLVLIVVETNWVMMGLLILVVGGFRGGLLTLGGIFLVFAPDGVLLSLSCIASLSLFLGAVVAHDGGAGTSIDHLVWSAGGAPKKQRVAVRDRAFLPGPPDLWVGSSISVAVTPLSCRDIEVWPYSVGMLVKWVAFLHSLH